MQFKTLLVLTPFILSVAAAPLAQADNGQQLEIRATAKKPAAKPAAVKPAAKPAVKPADKPADKPAPAPKPADKPADKPAAKPAPAASGGGAGGVVGDLVTGAVMGVAQDSLTNLVIAGATKTFSAIKALANWTKAREEFTKATTKDMWASNPDPAKYAAAICCNTDYTVAKPDGVAGKSSVELKSGALKVNYDCFYMTAGNTFTNKGDGGFINVAMQHNKCAFKGKTLTC